MITLRRALPAVLLALGLAAPAAAEDIMVGGKPCNAWCRAWMGVPDKATDSAAPPSAAPAVGHPPPIRAAGPPLSIAPRPPAFATRQPATGQAPGGAAPAGARPEPTAAAAAAPLPDPTATVPKEAARQAPERGAASEPSRREAAALEPARPADLTVALPTLHDSAQMPDMGRLVAVPGAIMVETAAERAANARQRAALMRATRSEAGGNVR